MKVGKKRFYSLAAALLFSITSLTAMDWGGILKNSSKALLPNFLDFGLSQTNDVYLWMNTPLGNSNMFFSAEGLYEFNYYYANETGLVSNYLDLDLFKFYGDFEFENSNTLSISLGRFTVSDASAAIYAQNIDGLFVKYNAGFINFSTYAGYTGLLNSQKVSMLDGEAQVFAYKSALYSLSNPYLPFNASIEFPALFGNQSFVFQLNGCADFGEQKANRFYATLWLTGPISNMCFYNVATVFGTKNFSSLMNFSTLDLYVYLSDIFFFSAGAEYASGKQGPFSPYVGITSRPVVASLTAPETSASFLPKVSATVILNQMSLALTGKFYMACPESSFEAQGAEMDFYLTYSIFPDFQIGVDVTSYFDVTSQKDNNNLTATLRFAVSF